MSLYNIERFDLDCTYSIGYFWQKLPQPLYKSDLYPKRKDVVMANSNNLPFNNLKSIIFDPPFVIAGETYKNNNKGSSVIAKRFGGFKDFPSLKKMYSETLKETYRVLQENGILVFKCQDVVSGGLNHFTHCLIMNMALRVGFYPKDLFILMAKNRMSAFGGKWQTQYHARKHHSYFWVFEKTKCKVNYADNT